MFVVIKAGTLRPKQDILLIPQPSFKNIRGFQTLILASGLVLDSGTNTFKDVSFGFGF